MAEPRRDPPSLDPDSLDPGWQERAAAASGARAEPGHLDPGDPLRLCVFSTVALLGWLLGPVAVLVFAGLAFAGYARARRAGLLRSRCLLGDTRLVLVWLGALAVVAAGFLVHDVVGWF